MTDLIGGKQRNGQVERRTQDRYQISARAVFSWEGPVQERFKGEGVTRDISSSGAFIVTTSCPPARAAIEVEFFLPPLQGTVAAVRLKAEALVLRVEQALVGDQERGFAVTSPGISFSRAGWIPKPD
jgi:hypothetical protein